MRAGRQHPVHRPGECMSRCRQWMLRPWVPLMLVALAWGAAAHAQISTQIDLSGNWAADNAGDEDMDPPDDPLPGNWFGIPLNAAGRARALMYSPAELAEPMLLCDYTPMYLMLGPFGLRIWSEIE